MLRIRLALAAAAAAFALVGAPAAHAQQQQISTSELNQMRFISAQSFSSMMQNTITP